ncbi:MAG: hypothetical protein K2H61_04565 [Muribaculaceae bacterium]|nr:hypothetical protein [Muribaculaceae bacterium]
MQLIHLASALALSIAGIFASSAVASEPLSADSLRGLTHEQAKIAQLKNDQKIIFVGSGEQTSRDSIQRAIELFYTDQFRHFQDPIAPYFMFMSKDAKLAMGIGGAVRMRAWGDFDGSISTNGFVPAMITVPSSPEHRRRIGGTPGGTVLFFKIIGRNKTLGDITGYIQADFSGDHNYFKLKKAYATINDWTIGLANTTFSDGAAQAPTIDGAGQNGKCSRSSMLVRWLHNFNPRWEMAASIELPSDNIAADGTLTKRLDDYLPDVATFGQFNFGNGSHIRLSGLLRFMPYRDLVNNTSHTRTGWGVQLSGVWNVIPSFSLFGEFNTGHGYSSYTADLSIGNYDLVPDKDAPGRLYAPLSMGLIAGARYDFSSKIYTTMALGKAAYYPSYQADPDDYRYGLYGSLCLFYEPTTRLQAGIEYLRGSRHNFSGQSASANRIDVLFQFSF